MAEIKIEKKSPVWPWILLFILLIAVILYFVYNNDNDGNTIFNENNDESVDTLSDSYEMNHETTAPYMGSLSVMQQFENSITDSVRIGVDSTYTKTAFANLARVVAMKADEVNVQKSMALENLKFYSDPSYVMTDTDMPTNKDAYGNFKTVSKDIVTVLETIQAKNYPSLKQDLQELKQVSGKIDTNIATKEQQTTVQTFFSKAKKVVNIMNS